MVARRAPTVGQAIIHGLLIGVVGSFVFGLIGGFLANLLPLGQWNFYLGTKLHRAEILDLWPQFAASFGQR